MSAPSPPPPPPAPPAVAAGTYLDGKTPLFPDGEGGLTGFTNLAPVLPVQSYSVVGTGCMQLTHLMDFTTHMQSDRHH